ncbi:uncharacterized protein LOC131621661 [Vicia villosa]|uniref:uncharacterized protein LOC131621661 n=1 Tax=Vicia villosa TaxID=3911 RepID=UPI00273C3E3C|nr:uncharacterized protein LOC131621661 [Vicia villosa]
MMIILDDVACLLHIPIIGRLLDHSKITKADVVEMMVVYLGAGLEEAFQYCKNTRGARAKFSWLAKLYNNLEIIENPDVSDLWVGYHKECALVCFFLFLVGMSMFVGKIAIYVDVTYHKYFIDLEFIHNWNYEAACLVYLYSKLNEGSCWMTQQMTGSCTLLTG